jgi:calcium-dependent protein kinase
MDQPRKIYIDDYMSDDDENNDDQADQPRMDRQQYEENKSKFDIKNLISNFILKREYFISHKTTNILNDYDFDKEPIGQGAFGIVYKAHEKNTDLVRAIKKVMNENIKNYDGFMGEVAALKTLDHPHIIKLFEVYEGKDCVYLVQEYCEGGELFDYIAGQEKLSEKETARIFHQITSSILYCHKNCICHRDLKPDNFMMASKLEESPVKLIDFGLSRSFFRYHDQGHAEMVRMETRAGTALYMAPEVLKKDYSNACDTWSLGVIMYIMLSGLLPFEGTTDSEIEESIMNLRYDYDDEVWEDISEDAKDLTSKMLVYEKDRITPKEALSHPWVKRMLFKTGTPTDKSEYMEKFEDFKDSNHLKKAILSFLATKVNDEEIKDEIELFNSFDSNNDGYITKKELK